MCKLKYRLITVLFAWISIVSPSFSQGKLVKTKVSPDITVSLPRDWRPMDGLDFTERYPSVRAPIAAYTSYERTTDFSVNTSATQWPDADISIARKFFKSSLLNMFDRIEMLSEGTREQHGKRYIYFEFESRVNGNRAHEGLNDPVLRYIYQMYLIEGNRTLVFSFSCPQREREQWQSTATAIMKSVRVD